MLHHDDVRSQCYAQRNETAAILKFTTAPPSPYSQDLATFHFWVFPKLKETLKGQHLSWNAVDEAAVLT